VSGGQAASLAPNPPPVARWFEARADGKVACQLCPHRCLVTEARPGKCGVRRWSAGGLTLPFYGRVSSLAVDPIEKKPLYHFHPGARILSAGFVGCSFHCKFCQNWEISQGTEAATRFLSPEELVAAARREGSFAIAYTYSEPLVHAEYVLESARLARAAGLKNVLVSNGYLNPGPTDEILPFIDAANIDLKGFDESFYRIETGGSLKDVERFLLQAAGRVHLEITTLVIPTKNDDTSQIEGIARFVASLGKDTPLHLSAYHPDYKYSIHATAPLSLRALADAARRHLRYVYVGNLGAEECDTACADCGNVLVRRRGYSVQVTGVRHGMCSACGAAAPIVGLD
jgi:pyruvate formate lyase activating enzyme